MSRLAICLLVLIGTILSGGACAQGISSSSPEHSDASHAVPSGALSVEPLRVSFQYEGQIKMVNVSLNKDNSVTRISNSSLLTATSSDSSIVTVSGAKLVAGSLDGTAIVTFRLNDLSIDITVTNESTGVAGDFNGDDKVDIDDLHILQAASEYPHAKVDSPKDARDLNHDGKIDEKDAEILKTLCTYQDCVTNQ